ncbi:MAG: hypothetical protein ABFD76_06795 [Smithella sp.]
MPINTKAYIEEYLKIKDKEARIIPLKLNRPQQKLYDALKEQARQGKPLRAIILKARQTGFSTLVEAMIYKGAATKKNISAGIVAHKESATTNLFRMSKRYYDLVPDPIRPTKQASNAQELIFGDLKSSIKCMTAGGDGIGRSDTFQMLHISEYAFWKGDKKETLSGLMQSVPNNSDTMVVIESTANGYDDFKEIWDRAENGESGFTPVFCAWWELDEYRTKYDGFKLTREEKKLKKLYNLDDEQIAWRRWCIQNNCGGDTEAFKQEYPSNPYEAFISTGTCIFDKEDIVQRIAKLAPPLKTGSFEYDYDGLKITNIHWVDDEKGFIKIYEEPKKYYPYVAGGDTAGEGSNWFTGPILDNTTGKQVAMLRHQFGEDLYARQMYCLGMYYNNALLGVEANYSTFPIAELERLGYYNQFVREKIDEYTGKREKRYGFKTTPLSRPLIIGNLVKVARENINLINDKKTLEEMLTFVRNEKGKPEAQEGKDDDCVLGLAIAHQIRNQQSYEPIMPVSPDEDRVPYDDQVRSFMDYGRK